MNYTFIELCVLIHMLMYILILVAGIINIKLLDKLDGEWSQIVNNMDTKELQKVFVAGLVLGALPVINISVLTVEMYVIIDTIKERKCENKDDI